MLVLTRKVGEAVVIAGAIHVTVVAVRGRKVRIGVTAPLDVSVDRQQVHALKRAQRQGPPPNVPGA
jgi:carbon storage regulator